MHEQIEQVGTGRRTGSWELYDLENNRMELRNLAAEQPERVRDLIRGYERWAARIGVRDWQELLHFGGFDNAKEIQSRHPVWPNRWQRKHTAKAFLGNGRKRAAACYLAAIS